MSARAQFIASIAIAYAAFAAAWIVFSDRIIAVFGDANTITWISTAKGLVFVAITTILLVLALRAVPAKEAGTVTLRVSVWPRIAVGMAVMLAVATITTLSSGALLRTFQQDAGERITAVARLKADAIGRWIGERRDDIRVIAADPAVLDAMQRLDTGFDASQLERLNDLLTRWRGHAGIVDIWILTRTGDLLGFDGTAARPPDPMLAAAAARGITTGGIGFVDIRIRDGRPYLSLVARLSVTDGDQRRPVGALVFDLDPQSFVFPALRAWPLPTRGGELVLIRQEGDTGVLLNTSALDQPWTEVRFVMPPDLGAIVAGGPGSDNARVYHDHRGALVIGARVAVPDTPWLVIAKEDEAEALKFGRRLVFTASGLIVAITLALVAAALVLDQRRRLSLALAEVERNRAQLTADARFRASFDNTSFGMGHLTLDGKFIRANARLAEMYGVPLDGLVDHLVTEFIPPASLDELSRLFRQVAAGEITSFTHERTQPRPDGTSIDIALTVSLSAAQGDDPPYLVGAVLDVTALRATEAALRHSEARLRAMFEATPHAVLVLAAPDRRILDVNPAACAMSGYTRDELIGMPVARLLPPDTMLAPIPASPDDDPPDTVEYRSVTRSGKEILVRASRARFDLPGDTSPLAMIVAEDVTEQRATEQKLRRALRMEVLGRLTGGIAHDFNNLLNVIVLEAEALVAEGDVAVAMSARSILNTALRGADLTQRLLAFARQQPLNNVTFDPADLLDQEVRLLRRTLTDAISIDLEVAAGLWPIYADPSELQNALLNLAINSRDAMPRGGRLMISAVNQVVPPAEADSMGIDAGDYVALSVSDNGCGMSPEIAERAMEPFFTTKEPGAGTGLGLASVHGFVHQSGGHLTITTALGVGTTIRLLFPRATMPPIGPSGETPPVGQEGHGRILLVEDNEALRALAARQLCSLGYQVTPVDDGAAGLAALRDGEPFDLLFTDVVMPGGLSGIELAQQAIRLRPGLKVLLTTGYSTALIDSPFMVLPKPYRYAELVARIQDVMNG
jgi:PAS domain S-box-containing protein